MKKVILASICFVFGVLLIMGAFSALNNDNRFSGGSHSIFEMGYFWGVLVGGALMVAGGYVIFTHFARRAAAPRKVEIVGGAAESLSNELGKLHDLFQTGAISQAEYDRAKAKLLGRDE